MIKPVVMFLMLPLCSTVFSQAPDEPDLQRLSDDLFGYQEEETNYEDVYENLVQILSSPFDLNSVTTEELKLLNLLNDTQIENFIAYRNQQGMFLDIYELQAIPGFDLSLISRLKRFVKVSDPSSTLGVSLIDRIFSSGHSYALARYGRTLEMKKGFRQSQGNPPSYAGSPDKLYFRFRSASPGDFSMGVTGEKDAGEKMTLDPRAGQPGFDFTSWHVQVQNKGKIKSFIAGDFQPQFAQGLLFGGAFGLGKGGETVLSTRKSNTRFLPYTSINESAYQRGAALTLQPGRNMLVSAFYSRTKRDATIDSAYTLAVTSFPSGGYHRTGNERKQRKTVTEENCGLVLEWQKDKFGVGLTINAIRFDIPVKRTPAIYNQYAFNGTQNFNTGMFLNYRLGNISFFSEAGQSLGAGMGMITGLLMNPYQHLDVAIVYRDYARDFHSFYSNAFSENSQPQNERGVYWGWKYQPNRRQSIAGYMDLFTFPWLSFRRYAPSRGYEWLLRGNYDPSQNVSLYVQLREESKPKNLQETTPIYLLGKALKRNVTLNCDYGVGDKIRLKSRIQYSSYFFDEKRSEGLTIVQDVSLSVGRFRFTGRHALFDTDDFDNRQYVYENDAWLAYSFPSYSGAGVRNYALIEYKVYKNLTLWARYARTRLLRADEIGSGQDAIAGNTRNDVKFQARFNF